MSKELVISANRHETKLAILEDDQLVEVFFQRANEYSLAGSIHKGRVTRVLPGMQSAFVDLGLERDTFLYVSDFFEENEEFDRVSVNRQESRPERHERPDRASRAPQESPGVEEPAGAADTETAAAVSSPEPSTGAPVRPERLGDGDGRDRQGRRSRRRRNRGRGFPDSKYASADSRESRYTSEYSRPPRAPEAAPSAEPTAAAPAVERTSGDLSVLPGESLAKYRSAGVQPLDEAEEEEIRSLQESDASAAEASSETGTEAAAESAPAAIENPPELNTAAEVVAPPQPEVYADPTAAEPAAEPVSEEESPAESDVEIEAAAEVGAAAQAQAEAEADAEAGVATETPAPTEAATEIPAPQLTAQVREQGGRYAHRGPRRMRRKMRGGGGQDSRFEQERRGDSDAVPAAGEASIARPEPPRSVSRPEKAPLPSITDLLKEGQEIIVQIAKEPLGQKGARITSHIALPGRFLVYMPTVDHIGVSRKIPSDEERLRLKRILQATRTGISGGYIVRTAGEGRTEEELRADMMFLYNLWLDMRQKAERRPAPVLIHHDLNVVERILRDQLTASYKSVWVDNEEAYESVLRFVQRFQPALVNRVKMYTRSTPIFDEFGITAELEKALRPKVWLKSGGYIVINQTEALVAIDINTGKYVGKSNRLEDTIVKTNTDAIKEIVRQIRLRDLGGIIVVDFIDMDERKNRQKVMQTLEEAMRADRAPYKILQFNDFGLVAITRKRVKQSLERTLCTPCPYCEGAGYVKSANTVIGEILQE
ncbi:MAG TPA: Rne/Rng family ribonuclease, partial [Bryobacteraceae bacterium]|nr:Rne/Rng family ribonuclease [Bryobacteraceae bacterium]